MFANNWKLEELLASRKQRSTLNASMIADLLNCTRLSASLAESISAHNGSMAAIFFLCHTQEKEYLRERRDLVRQKP